MRATCGVRRRTRDSQVRKRPARPSVLRESLKCCSDALGSRRDPSELLWITHRAMMARARRSLADECFHVV